MVAAPQALLACVPQADADVRGTVVGRGAIPLALIGASAGGKVGLRWGVLVFPRVLIPFIGLKGGAVHHVGRGGGVTIDVDALSQGVEVLA